MTYPCDVCEDRLYRSINSIDKRVAIFIPLTGWEIWLEPKYRRPECDVHHSDLRRRRHHFRKLCKNSPANLTFPFLATEKFSPANVPGSSRCYFVSAPCIEALMRPRSSDPFCPNLPCCCDSNTAIAVILTISETSEPGIRR